MLLCLYLKVAIIFDVLLEGHIVKARGRRNDAEAELVSRELATRRRQSLTVLGSDLPVGAVDAPLCNNIRTGVMHRAMG